MNNIHTSQINILNILIQFSRSTFLCSFFLLYKIVSQKTFRSPTAVYINVVIFVIDLVLFKWAFEVGAMAGENGLTEIRTCANAQKYFAGFWKIMLDTQTYWIVWVHGKRNSINIKFKIKYPQKFFFCQIFPFFH